MHSTYRLVVESGPDHGRNYVVPAAGCSLGRSSQNDIALRDELLSRMHCRFHYRGDELWVTDLASANSTLVDGEEVSERRLVVGSRVTVGESTLRVELDSGAAEVPAAAPVFTAVVTPMPESEPEAGTGGPSVDLGLAERSEEDAPAERRMKRTLLWSAATFLALMALALGVRKLLESPRSVARVTPLVAAAAPRTLEVRYEKVEATADNIFRYELSLDAAGKLAVVIDDIAQARHVRRETPAAVAPALVQDLARQIEQSGLFGLDPVYEGIALPNTHVAYDMTIVLGVEARRVRVANRNEPDPFRAVRERIETFGRNELGLWAVEFSRERLEALANDAYLLGAKLVQEKDIQTGNLYAATRSFRECSNYLETVEPKPPFFGQALAALRDANEELERRHTEQNFRADRAIKLKEWDTAATELRLLLDLIPDRADDRYRDAERRLLDVEARLKDRR